MYNYRLVINEENKIVCRTWLDIGFPEIIPDQPKEIAPSTMYMVWVMPNGRCVMNTNREEPEAIMLMGFCLTTDSGDWVKFKQTGSTVQFAIKGGFIDEY